MKNFRLKEIFLILLFHIRVIFSDDESFVLTSESNDLNYAKVCPLNTYNRTCCNSEEFMCGDGKCIPLYNVCNSIHPFSSHPELRMREYLAKLHCPDGSDEASCYRKSCSQLRNNTCEQSCIDLSENRSKCICKDGYAPVIKYAEKECVDVDECAAGANLCSHQCLNTVGSYRCECMRGFQYDYAGLEGYCQAYDRNIVILYYSDSWIYSYNMYNRSQKALIPTTAVDEINYDPVSSSLFWSSGNVISRSRYVPGAERGISTVNEVLKMAKGCFSLDWIAGNIYWLQSNPRSLKYSKIMVSKLDGSYTKTLIEVSSPNALVVDPPRGLLFFTISSASAYPYIGSARLDGEFQSILINLPGQNPTLITIDYWSDGKLFWLDSITSTIYYLDRSFQAVPMKVLTTTHRQTPLALDVFENHIYWVTKDTYEIVCHDKFGRGEINVLVRDLVDQKAFTIYHRIKLDLKKDGKSCEPHSCSYFCLHNPRGYKCACPDGYTADTRSSRLFCY